MLFSLLTNRLYQLIYSKPTNWLVSQNLRILFRKSHLKGHSNNILLYKKGLVYCKEMSVIQTIQLALTIFMDTKKCYDHFSYKGPCSLCELVVPVTLKSLNVSVIKMYLCISYLHYTKCNCLICRFSLRICKLM